MFEKIKKSFAKHQSQLRPNLATRGIYSFLQFGVVGYLQQLQLKKLIGTRLVPRRGHGRQMQHNKNFEKKVSPGNHAAALRPNKV